MIFVWSHDIFDHRTEMSSGFSIIRRRRERNIKVILYTTLINTYFQLRGFFDLMILVIKNYRE